MAFYRTFQWVDNNRINFHLPRCFLSYFLRVCVTSSSLNLFERGENVLSIVIKMLISKDIYRTDTTINILLRVSKSYEKCVSFPKETSFVSVVKERVMTINHIRFVREKKSVFWAPSYRSERDIIVSVINFVSHLNLNSLYIRVFFVHYDARNVLMYR